MTIALPCRRINLEVINIPNIILITIVLILGYLLGSIPFGVIISSIYRIDITKVGSGNVGATNVLRAIGILPAAIVFALDLLKGALAVYLAIIVLGDPLLIVLTGIAAILGHMFSIFLKFKGGRGASTGLGVLLAIAPDVFLFAVILAAIIISFTRYVSLASITVPLCSAALMLFLGKPMPYVVATAAAAILIIIKHVPNIRRLLSGTERKIGEKVQKAS